MRSTTSRKMACRSAASAACSREPTRSLNAVRPATRGYAGRITDRQGGKRSALQGAAVSALAGLLYLVAAIPGLFPAASLAVVVAGRLAAGLGESQLVTGCVSWSNASVGPQRAGMSMSWTGIVMFAALAVGAPAGLALYAAYGLPYAMAACCAAPLVATGLAARQEPHATPAGRRLPFQWVVGQIWREGLVGLRSFQNLPKQFPRRPGPP